MPENSVITPKQQRSLETQRKLLNALHFCLKDKFFEHITIQELAQNAGVSVGTFYRRFKDKESLLPLLYQDFGQRLSCWVDSLEKLEFKSLKQVLETLSIETWQFLEENKSVFRTLHLNSRLQTELLDSDTSVDRKVIYQRLSNIILCFKKEITVAGKTNAADSVIFIIITSLLDKVLYPDLTPAIASKLEVNKFAKELPKILLPYLTAEK
ncbi:MAG: TetR/AcrR family transcriptional regulator [Kangiellaceae bacterium]|nr:TetR/AcrR family transcriptional regulator [Kangiellaceae bacterium]MCW8999811.1 TetR/AcrR family transcriptional regulator [Kangiellaceae bacterium]